LVVETEYIEHYKKKYEEAKANIEHAQRAVDHFENLNKTEANEE
jgi:hypothetical protein